MTAETGMTEMIDMTAVTGMSGTAGVNINAAFMPAESAFYLPDWKGSQSYPHSALPMGIL